MVATDFITLSEAASLFPTAGGRKVHVSSVWRWCRKGSNGVRLRYVRVGRRIMTRPEWVTEFMQAVADADELPASLAKKPPSPVVQRHKGRTPAQRARAIAEADRQLSASGI